MWSHQWCVVCSDLTCSCKHIWSLDKIPQQKCLKEENWRKEQILMLFLHLKIWHHIICFNLLICDSSQVQFMNRKWARQSGKHSVTSFLDLVPFFFSFTCFICLPLLLHISRSFGSHTSYAMKSNPRFSFGVWMRIVMVIVWWIIT